MELPKAPDGWAELRVTLCIPRHVLVAIANSLQDKLLHGGYVDVNALIAEYDGTALNGGDVFELFATLGGRGELSDLHTRTRAGADCPHAPDGRADSADRDAHAPGSAGAGRVVAIVERGGDK